MDYRARPRARGAEGRPGGGHLSAKWCRVRRPRGIKEEAACSGAAEGILYKGEGLRQARWEGGRWEVAVRVWASVLHTKRLP